jgi:hypothetical protein
MRQQLDRVSIEFAKWRDLLDNTNTHENGAFQAQNASVLPPPPPVTRQA